MGGGPRPKIFTPPQIFLSKILFLVFYHVPPKWGALPPKFFAPQKNIFRKMLFLVFCRVPPEMGCPTPNFFNVTGGNLWWVGGR